MAKFTREHERSLERKHNREHGHEDGHRRGHALSATGQAYHRYLKEKKSFYFILKVVSYRVIRLASLTFRRKDDIFTSKFAASFLSGVREIVMGSSGKVSNIFGKLNRERQDGERERTAC